jgi:hypothetical protein
MVKNAGWKCSKMRDRNGKKCGIAIPHNKRGIISNPGFWAAYPALLYVFILPCDEHGTYLYSCLFDHQIRPESGVYRVFRVAYPSFKKSVATVF